MPRVIDGKPLTGAARQILDRLHLKWSSSLYLNMLGTPLRTCVVSGSTMPTALMLQLKCVEIRDKTASVPTNEYVMLPNHLLHPHFAWQKKGKGMWVTLDPRMLARLEQLRNYKMLNPRAQISDGFASLVHNQLSQRVAQEVQLLQRKPDSMSAVKSFETQQETERYIDTLREQIQENDLPSFVLSLTSLTNTPDPCSGTTAPPLMFQPQLFNEEHQEHLASLLSPHAAFHVFPAIPATAPLGIALYRLHLWTRSHPDN